MRTIFYLFIDPFSKTYNYFKILHPKSKIFFFYMNPIYITSTYYYYILVLQFKKKKNKCTISSDAKTFKNSKMFSCIFLKKSEE